MPLFLLLPPSSYRRSVRHRSISSSLSSMPSPGAVGRSMKPSLTAGSGQINSRRTGLSKTCGEMYSKRGEAGQAAWKYVPQPRLCRSSSHGESPGRPGARTVGDAADFGQAAATADVRLYDGDLAALQPFANLPPRGRSFRPANADRAAAANCAWPSRSSCCSVASAK